MPFIFTHDNADGINRSRAVTRKHNITDLHTVHKGIQNYSTTIIKIGFICNVLPIIVPSNTNVAIFQALRTDRVIPGSP